MTDSSLARKKKKVTYTASTQGIDRAENALKRLGFESKSNFAESQLLSRSTVTKFFQCQPIQFDSFERICKALKLDWAEVAGITEEGQSQGLERINYSSPDTDEVVQVQAVHRQVTVLDKQSKKIKAVIVLEGDINSVNSDLKVSLELALLTYPGDTIKITDIQAGSIRLIVEGSQEDIERLVSRIQLGELKELRGFPVEDIQILNDSLDDEESDELNDKWHLVQEIVNHPVKGRNLSDANLSGAYLIGADLIGADLSRANLSDVILSDANVENARFGNNQGISEPIKHDLIQKGAIFEDSPGDRSSILLPH